MTVRSSLEPVACAAKPNAEDVFDTVYELMSEAAPERFPEIY